jgi:nitrogen PTS system EIIA component
MNRLAAILPESHVLAGVDATSKKRAFEEAGLLFENLHGLSRALVTDSLFARERLGSTGLGHGVAIPHGRIKGLKAPMAAMFSLANPIGFDAPDEQPVSLLIFLLVPEAATQKHLCAGFEALTQRPCPWRHEALAEIDRLIFKA